jgi:hypothetical protein
MADRDDDDDLPLPKGDVPPPHSSDNPKTAAEVQAVLNAFDNVPPIDDQVRLTLQRWLYRQDKYLAVGARATSPWFCASSWRATSTEMPWLSRYCMRFHGSWGRGSRSMVSHSLMRWTPSN